jgi:hypothetical protein
MSTTASNKTVIGNFLEEVINQNRMERADDLVVEDVVELDRLPGLRQGKVEGGARWNAGGVSGMNWVVEEMVAEGDTTVPGLRGWVRTELRF